MKGEDHHNPIILSHGKLPNLILDHEHAKIQDSMFAIFMEDEERDVPVKTRNAFCPTKLQREAHAWSTSSILCFHGLDALRCPTRKRMVVALAGRFGRLIMKAVRWIPSR